MVSVLPDPALTQLPAHQYFGKRSEQGKDDQPPAAVLPLIGPPAPEPCCSPPLPQGWAWQACTLALFKSSVHFGKGGRAQEQPLPLTNASADSWTLSYKPWPLLLPRRYWVKQEEAQRQVIHQGQWDPRGHLLGRNLQTQERDSELQGLLPPAHALHVPSCVFWATWPISPNPIFLICEKEAITVPYSCLLLLNGLPQIQLKTVHSFSVSASQVSISLGWILLNQGLMRLAIKVSPRSSLEGPTSKPLWSLASVDFLQVVGLRTLASCCWLKAALSSLPCGPPQHGNLLHQRQQGEEFASKIVVRTIEVTSYPFCHSQLGASHRSYLYSRRGERRLTRAPSTRKQGLLERILEPEMYQLFHSHLWVRCMNSLMHGLGFLFNS